jgi:2,5-dioxopentanoate dehydrogenase
MAYEPVLIDGAWRQPRNPAGAFSAIDPSTRTPSVESYPVSGLDEVEEAVAASARAVVALRAVPRGTIAAFLEDFAARIEASREALVEIAARETGLPAVPRLRDVELPRTTNQLRQGAAAARERSWCQATIDTKANIRSKFGALGGAVVVFGPNNFPFAFNSVAGGDFVAAIAAGNPVIAKANTGHPGTSRLMATLAFEAVTAIGMPPASVQLIYRTPPDVGLRLVSHPLVGATGFTGSRNAGMKLKAAADRAGKPIYLEMSAVNPLFILPGALAERHAALASELYGSCAMGAGQFCTRPGVTVVQAGELAETFIAEVTACFRAGTPGTLLGPGGAASIAEGVAELVEHGASILCGGHEVPGPRCCYAPTLLRVSGDQFLANPHELQTEAFGTVNMVVIASDAAQMVAVAAALEGNLTGTIFSDTAGSDDEDYRVLEPVLREKVGRLLNDKMPTGVAVSPAMNHGGPFPSTGHPGFTAVGIPASLLRFAALHSYDNVRPHRLPPELGHTNPTGTMWRLIDGTWTQGDVVA